MRLLKRAIYLAQPLDQPHKLKSKQAALQFERITSLLLAFSLMAGFSVSGATAKSHHKHDTVESEVASADTADVSAGAGEKHKHRASSSKAIKIAAKEKSDKAESKTESKADAKTDVKSDAKTTKGDKKGEKSADKGKKGQSKAEEEKGKPGGLFGFGGGGKKKEKGAPAESAKGGTADKTEKAEAAEDPNAPKWRNDPALISVLRDISKSLKDSEAVQKIENPAEKLISKLAGESLERALAASGLQPNRILAEKDRSRMEKSMAAEVWESGDVQVSPELRASVVALWAKKIDGMLTVSIVGDYNGNVEGTEGRLGEFIAVIYAQSSIDKGFDIQSQQEVNYWIGKVSDLKIDRGATAVTEKKSYYRLQGPITARKRSYLEIVARYQDEKKQLAAKAAEEKKKAEEAQAAANSSQKMAEALAKSVAEALAKASKTPGSDKPAEGGNVGEKKSDGAVAEQQQTAPGTVTSADGRPADTAVASVAAGTPSASTVQQVSNQPNTVASIFPEPGRSSRGAWDSPAPTVPSHPPSPGAVVLYPARALAGQFLTASVTSANGTQPEPNVDLSFNGMSVPTNENGRILYQVPEDATPGYSLHLALAARAGEAAAAVNILQPLNLPSGPQVPKIDGLSPVVGGRGFMIIDGHNFDGIAERNRVIIDGANDATVLASSPVQIVAKIPPSLAPGAHTATVSTAGLRSNNGPFEFVTVDVNPVGPDTAKNDLRKLGVVVHGTQNKVRVRLTNQTRDIIKLVRGDEVVVVTSGGANNSAIVPAQRIRGGNFKIDTEILM